MTPNGSKWLVNGMIYQLLKGMPRYCTWVTCEVRLSGIGTYMGLFDNASILMVAHHFPYKDCPLAANPTMFRKNYEHALYVGSFATTCHV